MSIDYIGLLRSQSEISELWTTDIEPRWGCFLFSGTTGHYWDFIDRHLDGMIWGAPLNLFQVFFKESSDIIFTIRYMSSIMENKLCEIDQKISGVKYNLYRTFLPRSRTKGFLSRTLSPQSRTFNFLSRTWLPQRRTFNFLTRTLFPQSRTFDFLLRTELPPAWANNIADLRISY